MQGDGLDELPPVAAGDVGPLRRADVGARVIRGATVRGIGYAIGMMLTAAASVFLLRHLGVAGFGRYATVASLVAIIGGLTDAGLTAVGSRDLALRSPGDDRRGLLANLLGLRLVLTPIGVLVALGFALAAGYDRTLVVGTILAGIGLILTSAQATMTLPLSIDLKIGRLTATEVLKQAVMFVGVAGLVAAGAGLSPFFAVSIVVGAAVLVASPLIIGKDIVWRPAFDRAEWRTLIRQALPLAAAVVVGVLYFRLLILLMSLLSNDVETGLFATAFRITEILYSVATLGVTVVLPVLAVAAAERERFRYMLQRMLEMAVIGACFLIIVVVIVAEPVLRLLGGGQYRDAAPVLRIQAFALIPVFLGQVWVVGLIAIRRTSVQTIANALAVPVMLVLGVILIPLYGAVGAAIAALVAEVGYAGALIALFVRAEPSLRPSVGFLWKVCAAAGAAAALSCIPGLPLVAAGGLAALGYFAVLWLTRAIPREIIDAFTPGSAA